LDPFLITPHIAYAPPCDFDLDIVYHDESLLVLNKPSGLLSVPGRGVDKSDCLTTRVQKEFPDALSVHRLDMSTSGLMVLARGKEMHLRLSQLFRECKIEKCYVAIVTGLINSAVGAIDLPLNSDWPNRPRQKVDFTGGKNSLTRYRLLTHNAAAHSSRIELVPITGRTHQLRVHMAAIGHPIVGDTLYNELAYSATQRLLLHASMISFTHPFSSERLSLVSVAPF
jgi:tRNA pseudouridine32 synthase / 23S rRNA pseudouridine746 synthase